MASTDPPIGYGEVFTFLIERDFLCPTSDFGAVLIMVIRLDCENSDLVSFELQ